MNDHRLGWPAALLALERDERPSHVTPPRDKPKQLTFFEAVDFGKYVHFITEDDCRQIKSRVIKVGDLVVACCGPATIIAHHLRKDDPGHSGEPRE